MRKREPADTRNPLAHFARAGQWHHALERQSHFKRGRKTVVWITCEPTHHNIIKLRRNARCVNGRRLNVCLHHHVNELPFALGLEEPASREELPKRDGRRIHIRPTTDNVSLQLLGRDV